MIDLDMEMKAAVLREFIGVAARGQRPRQRNSEKRPAPVDQLQAVVFPHQRHAEVERTEPFTQQPFEASAPLFLGAGERAAGKRAPPTFATTTRAERDLDRNVLSSRRKAGNPCGEARERSVAAFDGGQALGAELAVEI